MSQPPFDRVRDLFHRVADLSAGEQSAFLEGQCAGDSELRREVEGLLARDAASRSQVRVGLVDHVDEAMAERMHRMPQRIGPYDILGLLGRGGMGVVYRARQQNPERVVALKVLRPAVFSDKLLQRFELEKQVLARLQHPGIAQIHEAGTTDIGFGIQPWFAMELIEGERLSDWATGRSTREKLELVVRICDAVHHAHLRGIVHRDLKPDNIIVDPDGRPRVLDFGVARVTDSDLQLTTIQTDVRALVGTLPYMSPEQAQGDVRKLDARSDIYALGVITYELLARELPYDLASKPVAVAARVIAEDDPVPLSSMDRVFRGDLETVVGKALEKEPERRYSTAEELAADIGRFLRDEPVRALPPSTWYQLRKLAKRNRKLLVMTAGAFLVLLLGTITSSVLALREARARNDAIEQAARAEQIASILRSVFAPPGTPDGPEVARRDVVGILDRAVERVETELANEVELAADMYYTVGYFYLTLGLHPDAERLLERAVEGHRRTADRSPEKLADSLSLLRSCYHTRRDSRRGAEACAELVDVYESMYGSEHPRTLNTRVFHATAVGMGGDLERAIALLRPLEAHVLGGSDAHNIEYLGSTYYRNGEFGRAGEVLGRLLAPSRDSTLDVTPDVRFWAGFQLAALSADIGRLDEAEAYTASMLEDAAIIDPAGVLTVSAYGKYMRGHVLHCLGRYVESERLAREAAAIVASNGDTTAFPYRELGMALLGQGRLEEAEAALQEYLDRQRGNHGDGQWYVGQAEALLGQAKRSLGSLTEAVELGRSGVERTRRSLRDDHPRVADALEPYAHTLVALERYEEAEAASREALEIRRRHMEEDAPPIAALLLVQAEIRLARGDAEAALGLAEQAVLGLQAVLEPDHPELTGALQVLERSLAAGVALNASAR